MKMESSFARGTFSCVIALVLLLAVGGASAFAATHANLKSFSFKNEWSMDFGVTVAKEQGQSDGQDYSLGLNWAAFDNLSLSTSVTYSIVTQDAADAVYETRGFSAVDFALSYTLWSDGVFSLGYGSTLSIPFVIREEIPTGYPGIYGTVVSKHGVKLKQKVSAIKTTFRYGIAGEYVRDGESAMAVLTGATVMALDPVTFDVGAKAKSSVTGSDKAQTVYVSPSISYAFPEIVSLSAFVDMPAHVINAHRVWVLGAGISIELKGKEPEDK